MFTITFPRRSPSTKVRVNDDPVKSRFKSCNFIIKEGNNNEKNLKNVMSCRSCSDRSCLGCLFWQDGRDLNKNHPTELSGWDYYVAPPFTRVLVWKHQNQQMNLWKNIQKQKLKSKRFLGMTFIQNGLVLANSNVQILVQHFQTK